mmetsp:Transcript_122965/g.244669  ORF Transcript_122965/g.244669 Transcript_122965/m.244669 type:complete len:375 (-) Transcript_122965:45-1169(-)
MPMAMADLEDEAVAIAGDVEIADEDSQNVQVLGVVVSSVNGDCVRRKTHGWRPPVRGRASSVEVVEDVVDINSDEESSPSSDSGSSSRSRSRQRNKSVGAAAATALLSAAEPLELDAADRDAERELTLATSFAARLQHEGGLVAIMVDTGSQISIMPLEADPSKSVLRICGGAHAVGRATASVEVAHEQYQRALSSGPVLGRVEVPAAYLGPVIGANGEGLLEVREKCAGIMIALMPAEQPGGPTVAVLGPGDAVQVSNAERELRSRLLLAEAAVEAASNGSATVLPEDNASALPVENPSNNSNSALAKPVTAVEEVGGVAARSDGGCPSASRTDAATSAATASEGKQGEVLPSSLGGDVIGGQLNCAGFHDVD